MSDKEVTSPRVARYKPYYYKPVAGKTYLWCRCGRSSNQPFCDGSHKGTGLGPVRYVATADDKEVLFCGCKQTKSRPFCDGSHNNLRNTYEEDDPQSESNLCVSLATHDRDGRVELNGDCFVGHVAKMPAISNGNIRWSTLVNRRTGAKYQSMFYMEVAAGNSPVLAFGDSDVVVLAIQGTGEIEISGRIFALSPETGIYVRPSERFCVHNAGTAPIALYLTVCPQIKAPTFGQSMLQNFDKAQPCRVVAFDPAKRQKMADRTFQLLVNKEIGSDLVTQFIGSIPCSKVAPHRHLYEETLVILGGNGTMWTEDMKANVRIGDIVFLPSKQMHSLQCTDANGMLVAGVIYPGGNPDINF